MILPAPFGPRSAWISPPRTTRRPRRARRPGRSCETSRTSTSSGASGRLEPRSRGHLLAGMGACAQLYRSEALGLVQAAYTVVNLQSEVAPRRPRRDRSRHRVDGGRRNASRASKRRIGKACSGKKPDSPTCAGVDILERELRAPTQLDRPAPATPAGPTSAGDQRGPGSWRGSRRGSGRLRRTRPRRPPGRTTSRWRTRQARIRGSSAAKSRLGQEDRFAQGRPVPRLLDQHGSGAGAAAA